MILGIFWFLVANAAALLGAWALLDRVRTRVPSADLVLFLLFRLALISGAVILAGLAGTLTALGLGIMGTAALGVLLAAGAHRTLRKPSLPEVGLFSGILAALVAARLLAQVWYFTPHIGDAIAYHLPKVAEWIRAGAFTREMGVDTHSTFPAGFELIETWWVVFLRHDVLIEMAGVEFIFLGFAATYALANSLGLGNRSAFFAAVLYALTPGLHLQATSCLNDGPAAALVVATAALIMARAPVRLVLVAVGLGIGVKATYGYALPGLALLWFLVRREPAATLVSRRLGTALAALALCVGGFWYVRNLAWYGSPTYPVGKYGLGGPYPIQFGPSLSSLYRNTSNLLETRINDSEGPYGALTSNISGWGAAAFACGILSLLAGLRADPRIRKLAVAFTLSLLGVFLFTLVDPWSMRFVLFFPALLAVATARLCVECRGAGVVAGLALILQFAGTIIPSELSLNAFHSLGRMGWRERTMAKVLGAWPPGETVGYFVDNRNAAYLLYRPDFSCRVIYFRSKSADDLLKDIDRSGVRTLFAAPAGIDHYEILSECVRRGRLLKIRGFLYSVQ